MDGPPFVLSILVSKIKFIKVLWDAGYIFYVVIDWKFDTQFVLKRMKIIFRKVQKSNCSKNGVCNEIILIRFNINKYIKSSFCSVAFKLKYEFFWGKPYMKKKRCSIPP